MTLMASTDFKDLLGLQIKRIIKPQISRMTLMALWTFRNYELNKLNELLNHRFRGLR